MTKALVVMTILFMLTGNSTFAQTQKYIALGVQAGMSRGANEGSYLGNQKLDVTLGGFILFRNVLGAGLSPELNIASTANGTSDKVTYGYYKNSNLTIDARLRWYPFQQDVNFAPYVFGGVGINSFSISEHDHAALPADGVLNGTALQFPIGLGLTHNLTNSLALDFQAMQSLALTDDLNPAHDGNNDAFFAAKIGLMYNVFNLATDTDGDGLSDEEELQLSTDKLNPDTDGDGLLDGEEVNKYKTNPNDPDTDDGGISDGLEVRLGLNPNDVQDDIAALQRGDSINIRNIEFNSGSSDLTGKSELILRRIAKVMEETKTIEYAIIGHTDSDGDDALNNELSTRRANVVRDWLITKGQIDGARLTADGRGEQFPVADNNTAAGKRRNRRVEFKRTK